MYYWYFILAVNMRLVVISWKKLNCWYHATINRWNIKRNDSIQFAILWSVAKTTPMLNKSVKFIFDCMQASSISCVLCKYILFQITLRTLRYQIRTLLTGLRMPEKCTRDRPQIDGRSLLDLWALLEDASQKAQEEKNSGRCYGRSPHRNLNMLRGFLKGSPDRETVLLVIWDTPLPHLE